MIGQQFHTEDPFETEREARHASRDKSVALIAALRAEGFTAFAPPAKPTDPDVIWDVFADCRILIRWMPPWIPSAYPDKFVLRIDTLAMKPDV